MAILSFIIVVVSLAFKLARGSQQLAADSLPDMALNSDSDVAATIERLESPEGSILKRRLSSTAVMDWAVGGGGILSDSGQSISALSDGSSASVVTGYFEDTASFGAAGSLTSAGNDDAFVGKVGSTGAWEWVVAVSSALNVKGRGISSLPDGSAVAVGDFSGTASFGSAGSLTVLGGAGGDAIAVYVAKLSSTGVFEWAVQASGGGFGTYVYSRGVSALIDGSAIVTGYFVPKATFGAAGSVESTYFNNGVNDLYVAKVSSTGVWEWAIKAGDTMRNYGIGLSTLADGSAIVCGSYQGAAPFEPAGSLPLAGGYDAFVAKVSSTGVWEWALSASGTLDEVSNAVSALADSSAVVTGVFKGAVSFGDAGTLVSAGSNDAFVAKVSSTGVWEWALSASGTLDVHGNSISALADGSALVTGFFEGTASFGAAGTLTSEGNHDVFVAKVSSTGAWEWAVRTGGADSDARGYSIAAFADGSAVVTGSFSGTVSIGPMTSVGGNDVLVFRVLPATVTTSSTTSTSTSASLPEYAIIIIALSALALVIAFCIVHFSSSDKKAPTAYGEEETPEGGSVIEMGPVPVSVP
jgi:hypothetical protein